ncbi:MAG: 30S ribosomal protein S16 [Candidatus Latescibacteria bacterium]|nr:30S ribosomal protein S16 [Candidatus Latescibacterota bacterium]
MAVKLRLMRLGASKQPFYRLVAGDSRVGRNGKYLEELGYYNSILNPEVIKIHEDRVVEWLNRGAVPTETVKSLLMREGILQRWNEARRGKPAIEGESELSSEELLRRELAESSAHALQREASDEPKEGPLPEAL